MTILFLIGGFPWLTILLTLIAFILGYLLIGRSNGIDQTSHDQFEGYKEKLEKLEADLMTCQQKQLDFQKEINEIKSRSKDEISSPINTDNPLKHHIDIIGEQEQDSRVDDSIAVPITTERQEDQDQKEKTPKRPSKFEALKDDNFQIVEGVGPKMESVLKENGIQNWSQLGEQTKETLRSILEKYGNKYKIIDPDSWPEQARHAASHNWSQLVRMQKGLDAGRDASLGNTPAKVEKVMVKLGIIKEYKQDDLKAIEGIGPKIAELLNAEGINSWKELAQTNVSALQNILDKAGKRYQLADPGSWPKQAALADEGRFDELSDYQDILQGGV